MHFQLKDLLIFENKIYISYTDESEEKIAGIQVLSTENMNYENIRFKELFLSKECIHSRENIDKEFGASAIRRKNDFF